MSRNTTPEAAGTLAWNVEKLTIGCSETEPVAAEAFTYDHRERSQFDMHYCLELGVVLAGTMDRYYQSGTRAYESGEVWLCGMWEPHGWGVDTIPCTVAVFFLHPPFLAQLHLPEAEALNWMAPFAASPSNRPGVASLHRRTVIDRARSAIEVPLNNPTARKVGLRLVVLEILLIMMDEWDTPTVARDWSGHEVASVGQAMQLALLSKDLLTTQEAAHQCGMNRNSFSRLFVEYMGISFSEFALRSRVSNAAAQLKERDDPVKAVAREWGFTDASHFHRCFMKYYGCSPSLYRDRNSWKSCSPALPRL